MPQPIELSTPLPPDALLLRECTSHESLGGLGETTLTLLSPRADIAADELLGKPATLKFAFAEQAPRQLNGIVTRFAQTGFRGRHHEYRMTLRPWLWLLTRTRDCRIFQNQSVPQIVEAVFADHPAARFESRLFRSYRPRAYCVQYRESDYDFVARLLEDEGIYHYLAHTPTAHTLILVDSASAHDAAPGCETLPFYVEGEQAPPQLEHVRRWSTAREVQPGKVVLCDYDFERPSSSLRTERACTRSHAFSDAEVFDYPGGYLQTPDGEQVAEVRLDEWQAGFEGFEGEANASGIACGRLLSLTRHPRDDQNTQYLVTGTTIRARQPVHESDDTPLSFGCGFEAIAAGQQFRPQRRTRRPQLAGPQTARVVGPAGEEIYTDKYGRVKLQFHWDRRGRGDEASSCWVSVAQPWAGANFGGVQVPRIGQEVIVGFLEGDPDRPIVIGRAYNGENLPPWDLPANATQSGVLTRSSRGGAYANANAIRFEDKAGAEQLWLHAERNQDVEVERDETHWVGNDRRKNVDHDETTTIGNHRTETVGANETITIGADRRESVGANEGIAIGARRDEQVGADETVLIGANRAHTIAAHETLSVGGNRTATVSGSETASVALQRTHTVGVNETIGIGAAQEVVIGAAQLVAVGAMQDVTVGANQSTRVGANQSTEVKVNRSVDVGGSQSTTVGKARTTSVDDDDTLGVGKNLRITAGDSVSIKVGKASITLHRNGTINIQGEDLLFDGAKIVGKAKGSLTMKGSKILQN
jgi:type VI secretion system secreted protein VgrG